MLLVNYILKTTYLGYIESNKNVAEIDFTCFFSFCDVAHIPCAGQRCLEGPEQGGREEQAGEAPFEATVWGGQGNRFLWDQSGGCVSHFMSCPKAVWQEG